MKQPFRPAIIAHGGAGPIKDDSLSERLDGCRRAAIAGWEILERGGSALDAVEAAVIVLEDDPLFNAGTGSTLNLLGEVEMDAAIMDGKALRAGAVAAVSRIKNPIRLARCVMDDGRHVLLAGEGALRFARSIQFTECPPDALVAASAKQRWDEKYGTVGCVALDAAGNLAAATSTGGIFGKLPGRVGDSPLIGCGTYADGLGGVSCTGHGESIIRVVLAKSATAYLSENIEPQAAAGRAVDLLAGKTGSTGGLIMIDRAGRVGYARNTTHMPVCCVIEGDVRMDS
jgi:L-asparaginase / beta-aspartyl-peptidase